MSWSLSVMSMTVKGMQSALAWPCMVALVYVEVETYVILIGILGVCKVRESRSLYPEEYEF